MKRLLVILFAVVMATAMMAIPAKRQKRILKLADGTTIEAMLVGDEHGHWWVDDTGSAIRVKDGIAQYMTDAEFTQLKAVRKTKADKSNARRVARMEARRLTPALNGARRTFGEPTAITGNMKGLVILINFSDKSFNTANTRQSFDDRFNKEGYTATNYVGSVHDYFYDQSYGQFNLTFDVVGPVTVSKTHDYYGANDDDGNDKYPATLAQEALKLADSQVNYSDYDWDGDGEVDQVFFIYAGTGEASSDVENDIWPHEWNLTEAKEYNDGTGSMTLDGVKLDTYAMSNELASATTIDGIGCACHEFSHCLGYADLYDIDYSGGQGMRYWDLMDAGSYNGPNDDGEVPAPFTSFERWWAGWMNLTELSEPCKVDGMKALTSEPVAYVIYNQAHKDEYYLLENHQNEKWDAYTGGHGMMILHVDYDKSVWQQDAPNDTPSRQRMTYFPADNSYGTKQSYNEQTYWSTSYTQLAGDPWPGTSNKTSFTDTTTPAAILYNANTDGRKYMGKPIEDISESSDGLISFKFDGGVVIPTPEIKDPTNVTSNSFTANWGEVAEATSYSLEVVDLDTTQVQQTILNDDFSKVTATSDGALNVSSKLDTYTDVAGWTGSVLYLAPGGLKVGSSKSNGYLYTPLLDAPSDGKILLKAQLESYGTDATGIIISIVDESKMTIFGSEVCTPSQKGEYSFSFTGITQDFKVKFATPSTKKRFYIYGVTVESGSTSSKTLNYTGLAGTSYDVTGLTGSAFKYRVMAVNEDGNSKWSDYKEVVVPTGINEIQLSTTESEPSSIYTISGQRVQKADRPGLYIQNGHVYIK